MSSLDYQSAGVEAGRRSRKKAIWLFVVLASPFLLFTAVTNLGDAVVARQKDVLLREHFGEASHETAFDHLVGLTEGEVDRKFAAAGASAQRGFGRSQPSAEWFSVYTFKFRSGWNDLLLEVEIHFDENDRVREIETRAWGG